MRDQRIAQQHHATFQSICHVDDEGNEYWLAWPLAKVLDFSEYRYFLPVAERGKEAYRNVGQASVDHIEDVLHMVDMGTGESARNSANKNLEKKS